MTIKPSLPPAIRQEADGGVFAPELHRRGDELVGRDYIGRENPPPTVRPTQ